MEKDEVFNSVNTNNVNSNRNMLTKIVNFRLKKMHLNKFHLDDITHLQLQYVNQNIKSMNNSLTLNIVDATSRETNYLSSSHK